MFETQGGTRNRTRDLPKKGSAFITSSDHWTRMLDCRQGGCPNVFRFICNTTIRDVAVLKIAQSHDHLIDEVHTTSFGTQQNIRRD